MTKKLFFLIIIFAFSFVLIGQASALDCGPKPSEKRDCSNYLQCKCESNNVCGDDLLERTCHKHKYRDCDCDEDTGTWDCSSWGSCKNPTCGSSRERDGCEEWEFCEGDTDWVSCDHECVCDPDCMEIPENPTLYDGVEEVPTVDVKLPLRYEWDDVDGALSYRYRAWKIDPLTTTLWIDAEIEVKNEGLSLATTVIPVSDPCYLQLGPYTEYSQATSTNWQVTPCCDLAGTDCIPWNDVNTWFYELSMAPQLISPVDPDWNSTTLRAEDVPIPVLLQWCNVADNDYYHHFNQYYLLKVWDVDADTEEETCNPYFIEEDKCVGKEIKNPPIIEGDPFNYEDPIAKYLDSGAFSYFIPNSIHRWEVASCHWGLGEGGGTHICSSWSQRWEVGVEDVEPSDITEFSLLSPPDDDSPYEPIGFPIRISWQNELGLNSFRYTIRRVGFIGPVWANIAEPGQASAEFGYGELDLDTAYEWNVKGCEDLDASDCSVWASPSDWVFKTTGGASDLEFPDPNQSDVILPIGFDWSEVGGAKSYKFQVAENAGFADVLLESLPREHRISISYPRLEMEKTYWWRVQTCADLSSEYCGPWSGTRRFTTFKLETPQNLNPPNGENIDDPHTVNLTWDPVPGAQAYKIVIIDTSGEVLFDKIVSSNSFSESTMSFPEVGIYKWQVWSCLDKDCNVTSSPSSEISFNLALIASEDMKGGIVPCGRKYDDPDTPWNERDKCEIKHLFLLMSNIVSYGSNVLYFSRRNLSYGSCKSCCQSYGNRICCYLCCLVFSEFPFSSHGI